MVESLRDAGTEQQEGCTHHWRIASPSGETSKGVCKACGATREFQNYAYRSSMSRLRKPASGNRAASSR
jgi:hypothetical protein